MSATKNMRKMVKTAENWQLEEWENSLKEFVITERNPMKRSSLKEQIQIIQAERKKRAA